MFGLKRFEGNVRATEQACNTGFVSMHSGSLRRNNNTLVWILLFVGSFLAIVALAGTVSAYSTPESIAAAGKVYVSSVTIDPEVFFSGEKGTATFYVTNGNANESIVVNHATFGDKDISLISGTYDTSANIGPLQTRTFVFSIATDAFEGMYYPTFSLSLRDADSLYYRTPVKVENTPLVLTVVDKSDTFTQNNKASIIVQIANPRENDVKNVILEVSGNGITATPSKIYIGDLASGTATNKTFSITPSKESPVNITVTYDNGDNPHAFSIDLPVTFSKNKKQADPKMNNIIIKMEGTVYHVTGDVTNAGLETANAVTISSLSPATAEDPYKTYVVGVLKPDDFGSFEVTFTADDQTSVPLQMSYKDTDGNVITTQQTINLATAISSENSVAQPSLLPIIGVILIITLAAGGYLFVKRRKNQ